MSGAESAEKEKKVKPPLVRLGQNGSARSPALLGLGSPKAAHVLGSPRTTLSPLGTPKLATGQLHTFRSQRDLTLGAKPAVTPLAKPLERKKFVPNLNVQRLVKKESDETDKVENRGGKRRKENKHERREKNSRDRPNLIQTGSIFSEGIGGDGGIRRRIGGGGSSSRGDSEPCQLVKPKLDLSNQKLDREAEEERLKSILRDDFIDDLKGGSFVPVQLPMIETGKMFKSEVKKIEPEDDEIRPKLLNKKRSELDSDDEDDPMPANSKPVIDEELSKPGETSSTDPSVGQLLTQQTGQLVFIQFPDSIPLLSEKVEGSLEPSGSNISSLGNLEGRLGKLQIRKSGRCQLILGQERLDVETGTKVGFLQDAVSVRVPGAPEEGGELTVLGHVAHRLVLTPDWDHLLKETGLNDTLA